jgi:hypothetical protein
MTSFPNHQTIEMPFMSARDKKYCMPFTTTEYYYKGYNYPIFHEDPKFYKRIKETAESVWSKCKSLNAKQECVKEFKKLLDLIVFLVENYRKSKNLPKCFQPSSKMIDDALMPFFKWRGYFAKFSDTDDMREHGLWEWCVGIEILLQAKEIECDKMNGPLYRTWKGFSKKDIYNILGAHLN